jgi:hypothetical protein
MNMKRSVTAGSRVKVVEAGPVPQGSEWDEDNQRTSTSTKKRLQKLFFEGNKKVQAEVVFVASETDRERLKRNKQIKVLVREPSGSSAVFTVDAENVTAA